jgi:hypothetical protein
MQRVVRSSLIGLLAIAGLTACGDKVEIGGPTTTAPSTVVRSVTVSPPSATLNSGDKITLAASVNADAGVTDRTVTWASTNTAIANVDANGVVTAGTTAGTTSIVASSKADPSVKGAATITVNSGPGNGAPATVTISSMNQTNCAIGLAGGVTCSSTPANLANIVGQIDVTLNVEPGQQRLLGVDLVMNCTGAGNSGADTVVASQTLASTNVAPEVDAAAAPVTISFNTASFNTTTGATAFKNGNCTIKARARTNATPGGAVTTVTSTAQTVVLNNPDVVIGNLTASKTATHPTTGLAWNGGDVTITTLPVFFSNRTAVNTIVTFEGRTVRVNGGAQSVKFVDRNDPSIGAASGAGIIATTAGVLTTDTLDIDGITDPAAHATLAINVIDSNGQNFANANGSIVSAASYLATPTAPASPFSATTPFRLDTQKPMSGTLNFAGNAEQGTGAFAGSTGAYLNSSFRFVADSAAGYRGADALFGTATCPVGTVATRTSNCDFGGVDSVTVQFFAGTAGTIAGGTGTKVTTITALAETNTNNADAAFEISTDRLGNADTVLVCSTTVMAGGTCLQLSAAVAAGALNGSARFGVDKTAPTQTFTAGELNQATFTDATVPGNYFVSVTDAGTVGGAGVGTYAGSGTILVAQTRQTNRFSATSDMTGFENHVLSNLGSATVGPLSALRSTNESLFALNTDGNNPCTIGRFNVSSTKAGANALQVFARDGTVIGFCTPVAFQPVLTGPAGTSGVPAVAGGTNGYYRTEIVPTDLANNTGAPFLSAILVDPNAPVVQSVDIPQTIAGGSTVSFPANVIDTATSNSGTTGDIVGSWVAIAYPTATLQYAVTAGPGVAFDNVLTRTATVTPAAAPFIRQLQANNGAAAPTNTTANSSNATTITVSAIDAANLVGSSTVTVASQPVQFTGGVTNYTAGTINNVAGTFFTGGFSIAANTTLVSNCPAATFCGAVAGTAATNPTTTTITATATGQSGVFNNPFSTVQLWYRPTGTTTWFLATATQAGTTSSDNGTNRTWIYAFTFDPPAATPVSAAGAPQNLTPANGATISMDVMVIGVNSNGSAISTPVQAITLTNP